MEAWDGLDMSYTNNDKMAFSVSDDLLTTRAAAALLGVGTTSVKRWADQGVLRCVKTPGGHRRIPRAAIAEFLNRGDAPASSSPADRVATWVDRLVRGTRGAEIRDALIAERAERGSWWRVADSMGPVISEIGRQWATGEINVLQEHIASARLERGLVRCAEDIPLAANAVEAVLVAAPGDDHTLGLSLAELCLREAGFLTRWAGRRTPAEHLEDFVAGGAASLVAVSASSYSTDGPALARFAERLAAACERGGAKLVLGGSGPWPPYPKGAVRVRSFEELQAVLPELMS